jgi:hypothetical protein
MADRIGVVLPVRRFFETVAGFVLAQSNCRRPASTSTLVDGDLN